MPRRFPKKPPEPFNKKLVLNNYLLSLFGASSFAELASKINHPSLEGMEADNVTRFHNILSNAKISIRLDRDSLQVYDRNIINHTRALQGRRPTVISWKYFQYLALLFTEIYLDNYINHKDILLDNLNRHLQDFNRTLVNNEKLPEFTEEDLRRISFWSATGSGKTLIMHANIKQFLHYLGKANRRREINRILLITPNEGLSRQHLAEMQVSGIEASIFTKAGTGLLRRNGVEIIDIHKLAEKDGEKTVAVDSFEHSNLVLTDEAHRGARGDVWGRYRSRLARDGFTMEYSATLGQVAANNKKLAEQYAKSIIFDYSYRHFHGDGYGKNYRILNLPEDDNEDQREMYLTACMLSFYQQKLLFEDKAAEAKRYNIENPLCVFVGSSVNAVRTQNKRQVSDVIDVLLFLARLASAENQAAVIDRIDKIKDGRASLASETGDVFADMFKSLFGRRKSAAAIYKDMLKRIFNSNTSATLHLEELKGSDGEITLRLGNNEPFGLVNVGDAPKLCKLSQEYDELVVSARSFTGSLFQAINNPDSTINMLIGSKRFSEGWNSWRVSTMGLMNVGQKEGTEVIQLFGRGVRLWGLGKGLKRHKALLGQGDKGNDKLEACETLNVFGVRSNYMAQFKLFLESEGVTTGDNFQEILWPVKPTLPEYGKLKTIKVKEGLDFTRDVEKCEFRLLIDLRLTPVVLDYYPRVETDVSEELKKESSSRTRHSATFQPGHLALLDTGALYLDLQQLKKDRGWFNLCFSKSDMEAILFDTGWYQLLIPPESLEFDSFERVSFWQDIASALLRTYCERFYKGSRSGWEAPHREYDLFADDDLNMVAEYRIQVPQNDTALIEEIQEAIKQFKRGKLNSREPVTLGPHEAILFDQLLYQPLITIANDDIKVTPVALNKGEADFVKALKAQHINRNPMLDGKELYLLRNMSRGKGLGFFEAGNFYPDFILWLLDKEKQHICFIDPKGLQHLSSPQDPKIEFHKTIKDIERQMGDNNIHLHAFIISVTPFSTMQSKWPEWNSQDYTTHNVFFQESPGYINQMLQQIVN